MQKKSQRAKRQRRVRSKVAGTGERPRLSVFRSNKYIYGQIINDEKGITLLSQSDINLDSKSLKEGTNLRGKLKKAYLAGEKLAAGALKRKVTKVVFDKSGYKYHGRIKAFADGARKGGLIF